MEPIVYREIYLRVPLVADCRIHDGGAPEAVFIAWGDIPYQANPTRNAARGHNAHELVFSGPYMDPILFDQI